MTNVFLLSWDMHGLEACINVSDIEKEQVWNTLQDKESPKIGNLVTQLMLRARYNPQRHYEIYSVHVEPDVTETDLRRIFDENPQYAAEMIRERGVKLYSDRLDKQTVRIT